MCEPFSRVLANGLTVAWLPDDTAPLVSTTLWYRAGTAHEPPAASGLAHFLEHMMFKGSSSFAAGEIDRRTLALGGSNNAFTSHDGALYVFSLPREHWRLPLEVEADRMGSLRLEPEAVDSERTVIVEEIGEAEDDPWDALSMRALETLFGEHPYGRRILGSRESLARIGGDELRRFHAELYGPGNAVLTIAGDVGPEAVDEAARLLGAVEPRGRALSVQPAPTVDSLQRVDVPLGRTRRGLLVLPGPAAGTRDFVHSRMALTALTGGRAGILQRRLVEEGRLCHSVSSEITESVAPGAASLAFEVLPGVDRRQVEEALFEALADCRRGLDIDVVERARRLLLSDWLFGHETIEARGATIGAGLALFGVGYARRQYEALLEASLEDVEAAARRYLDPEAGAVLGWAGG